MACYGAHVSINHFKHGQGKQIHYQWSVPGKPSTYVTFSSGTYRDNSVCSTVTSGNHQVFSSLIELGDGSRNWHMGLVFLNEMSRPMVPQCSRAGEGLTQTAASTNTTKVFSVLQKGGEGSNT